MNTFGILFEKMFFSSEELEDRNEHYIGFTSTNISITRIPRIVCVTSATH